VLFRSASPSLPTRLPAFLRRFNIVPNPALKADARDLSLVRWPRVSHSPCYSRRGAGAAYLHR
jgi:hypothetical protein